MLLQIGKRRGKTPILKTGTVAKKAKKEDQGQGGVQVNLREAPCNFSALPLPEQYITGVCKPLIKIWHKMFPFQHSSGSGDAWALYMAEVQRYTSNTCQEEDRSRPLVK